MDASDAVCGCGGFGIVSCGGSKCRCGTPLHLQQQHGCGCRATLDSEVKFAANLGLAAMVLFKILCCNVCDCCVALWWLR